MLNRTWIDAGLDKLAPKGDNVRAVHVEQGRLLCWIDRLARLGHHQVSPARLEPCPDWLDAALWCVGVLLHKPELLVELD